MFDEGRGVVRNDHGRVSNEKRSGLFVSGWLKRGPSGIIGTNIADAKDTVASIMDDILSENIKLSHHNDNEKGRHSLDALLEEREVKKVDWASYKRIAAAEMDPSRLRSTKQPREKFTSLDEMLTYIK